MTTRRHFIEIAGAAVVAPALANLPTTPRMSAEEAVFWERFLSEQEAEDFFAVVDQRAPIDFIVTPSMLKLEGKNVQEFHNCYVSNPCLSGLCAFAS